MVVIITSLMRTGRMTKVPTDHGNVALVHKDACSSFIVTNRGNLDISICTQGRGGHEDARLEETDGFLAKAQTARG